MSKEINIIYSLTPPYGHPLHRHLIITDSWLRLRERKPPQISKFNPLNVDTPSVRTLPAAGNLLKPLP